MKKLTLALLLTSGLAVSAQSQSKFETTSISVDGLCGMCEERIENAAYLPGVKKADWSQETHQLDLVFNANKTSLEDIIAAVNAAGHDVEGSAATDEQYANIHGCCRYRDEAVQTQHSGPNAGQHQQMGHEAHHGHHKTTTAAPEAEAPACNHEAGKCSGNCEHHAEAQTEGEAHSCNHEAGKCSGNCEHHAEAQTEGEAHTCNHEAGGRAKGCCEKKR